MRKSAKQQVEEIEFARFEMYMTLFLLDLGIELANQFSYIEYMKKEIEKEKELREAWEKYQSTAHPEDRMSYVEFLSEMGIELWQQEVEQQQKIKTDQ